MKKKRNRERYVTKLSFVTFARVLFKKIKITRKLHFGVNARKSGGCTRHFDLLYRTVDRVTRETENLVSDLNSR